MHVDNGRVQVAGQVAVMNINGLLCKVIFDQNPTNSFYVEESFPLKWMYPYETPFGIIMKINRNPLPELSDDVFKLDHEFWSKYATRLCGNWITYDTSVQDIANFVDRTYMKTITRAISATAPLCAMTARKRPFPSSAVPRPACIRARMSPQCPPEYRQKSSASQEALVKETEFAFKQAFAFCPYSPEAVYRYVNFLHEMAQTEEMTGHMDQAARHFR